MKWNNPMDGLNAPTDVMLGNGPLDAPQVWDPSRSSAHLLLHGGAGTGKSNFIKQMLATWQSRCSSVELQHLILAPSPIDHGSFLDSPLQWLRPAMHIDYVRWALLAVSVEMNGRLDLMRAHKVRDVGDLPSEFKKPRLVLVIDEAEYVATKAGVDVINAIISGGRAAGIHLVAATQRVSPAGSGIDWGAVGTRVEFVRRGEAIVREKGGCVLVHPPFITEMQLFQLFCKETIWETRR